METKTMKTVLTVVERGGKSYWTRVGVGFVNRDGSLSLRLDAIPVNGNLQVREWEPYDRRFEPGADATASARRPFDADASTLPVSEPPRVRRREPPATVPPRDVADGSTRNPYAGDALA